ncbi:sodium:solute symporter family transporter [Oceanimonas doudoroffii]|uniref:Sodium:proline symporter n=1 Tax=Oceanimonas doudoroffii TaxID=84158 RepID=A0A233RGA6_9GAMM|nr:sodium:proline symporter [Oceanimonas doudoroffii]OXY82423.1 sodium:proline symporter [Oceanimonas doudoroffii]
MVEFPVIALVVMLAGVGLLSLMLAPRVRTAEGFFAGQNEQGGAPGLLTLVFSQVTTWIFARSLLNAAILGYFYGVAGALAYSAYYGSFLTGWLIVDRLRYRYGAHNIQGFLAARFGRVGVSCYNLLISLRLLSEVFANLLVVGMVFGLAGSQAHTVAMVAVAGLTLLYSMSGGLRASLRTDVLQVGLLLVLIALLTLQALMHPLFSWPAVLASSPEWTSPGWILLAVALLQVLSYPLHDPVMMDRGFLADRGTTRRSFIHAFWLSALLILAFGLLGVFAGLQATDGEELLPALQRLLGTHAMLLLGLALVISAASTLDSTLASAAKLMVMDMGLGRPTAGSGRLAMAGFALGGLVLVFTGSQDLFDAVAVSGTASLALTPLILFCILGGREVARWSFVLTFVLAVAGAALYFLEKGGHVSLIGPWFGVEHSYAKLLVITLVILAAGLLSFFLGLKPRAPAAHTAGNSEDSNT